MIGIKKRRAKRIKIPAEHEARRVKETCNFRQTIGDSEQFLALQRHG
jgi:hypothetical protein